MAVSDYIIGMVGSLYNGEIIALAGNISRVGELPDVEKSLRKTSKLCGSWFEIDLIMDGDVVDDCAIRLEACVIGQAAAAILTGNIVGASAREIKDARDGLRAMLKDGAEPPKGRFEQLSLLQGVAEYPQRHDSAMIAFCTAAEAVQTITAEPAL